MAYNKKTALQRNIEAIRTAFYINRTGEKANDEQIKVLELYTGFGGLKCILDNRPQELWAKDERVLYPLVQELKKLIHDECREDNKKEQRYWSSLKNSVMTAFYTNDDFIKSIGNAIWNNAGKINNMIDPSSGSGRFLHVFDGLGNIKKVAYEKDIISGLILKAKETEAEIRINGFESFPKREEGEYDIAITNIPFGDIRVSDLQFSMGNEIKRKSTFQIHNYFFLKGLDVIKDGGLIAFITSRGVADSKTNEIIRRELMEHSNLIGAFRLPDSIFKDEAGIEVGSDLIILQKNEKKERITDREKDFISSDDEINVFKNHFFRKNQDEISVIGNQIIGKDQFGKNYIKVENNRGGKEIGDIVAKAINLSFDSYYSTALAELESVIPDNGTKNVLGTELVSLFDLFRIDDDERTQIKITGKRKQEREKQEQKKESILLDVENINSHYAAGTIFEYENKIGVLGYTANGMYEFKPLDNLSQREKDILSVYSQLRDCYWNLFDYEEKNEIENKEERENLNRLYDTFVQRFGGLRDSGNASMLMMDVNADEILSLEKYKDGERVKADIFTEPVAFNVAIDDILTPQEALASSLNLYGIVDLDYIEERSAFDRNGILQELKGQIYYNPLQDKWEAAGKMISGNVYSKIETFRNITELDDKQKGWVNDTINALENSKPDLIAFEDLDLNFGERWIPEYVYNEFATEIFGVDSTVSYIPANDTFIVKMNGYSAAAQDLWSVNYDLGPTEVMQNALLNTRPEITKKEWVDGEWKKVKDIEACQLASTKIEEMQQAFTQFIDDKPVDFKDEIAMLYNQKFNCFVRPSYDGSFQTFPDLSFDSFDYDELYKSQKDCIWMLKQNGGGICDHEVGAGKTMIMCVAAHEMKRIGVANKPLIIALKANVHEIAQTYQKAYPNAKILYPGKDDFTKAKRENVFRDIKNNNYDCIILTHDQFGKIPQSLDIQREMMEEEIQNIEDSLNAIDDKDLGWASRSIQKGLEKRKENLKAKLNDIIDSINSNKDEVIDFRQMGIDHIFVDESHQFKNLMFQTRHSRVAGLGNTTGSKRSANLLFAIRDIQYRTGRDLGATFLSGTTISNSLTELYVLFKYLRPNALIEQGFNCFDAWAANYTRKSTEFEFSVVNEPQQKERFRYFVKVPELAMFYNEVTDYRTAEMIGIDRPEKNEMLINIPPTPAQEDFISKLVRFAKSGDISVLGLGRIELTDEERRAKMILATDFARKMALDMRMIDPFKYENETNNKASVCAEKIYNYYKNFEQQKGTQFVFSDLGTYKLGVWNIYTEIKNQLVENYGIPENEIKFIQQCKNENERKKVIDGMNDGTVRVLFGSTSMLGTGVNAQKRAVAVHHLDIPWRPSDLEQREGRAVRKGNIIAKKYAGNKVDVLIYATEKSLDAYKFGLLSNKALFISQLKKQQLGSRTLDEGAMDEKGGMSFAEYVAVLSGNTDMLDKAKLDKQVKQLEQEKTLFMKGRNKTERTIAQLKDSIATNKAAVIDMELDYVAFMQGIRQKGENIYTNDGAVIPKGNIGKYMHRLRGIYMNQNLKEWKCFGKFGNANLQVKNSDCSVVISLAGEKTGRTYLLGRGGIPQATGEVANYLYRLGSTLQERAVEMKKNIANRERDMLHLITSLNENRIWGKEDKLAELKKQVAALDAKILEEIKRLEENKDSSEERKEVKEKRITDVLVEVAFPGCIKLKAKVDGYEREVQLTPEQTAVIKNEESTKEKVAEEIFTETYCKKYERDIKVRGLIDKFAPYIGKEVEYSINGDRHTGFLIKTNPLGDEKNPYLNCMFKRDESISQIKVNLEDDFEITPVSAEKENLSTGRGW